MQQDNLSASSLPPNLALNAARPPARPAGPALNFLLLSWLYALYCFDYKWALHSVQLQQRIAYFERHWAFFLGKALAHCFPHNWSPLLLPCSGSGQEGGPGLVRAGTKASATGRSVCRRGRGWHVSFGIGSALPMGPTGLIVVSQKSCSTNGLHPARQPAGRFMPHPAYPLVSPSSPRLPLPGFGAATVLPMALTSFYVGAALVGVLFPLWIMMACDSNPRLVYQRGEATGGPEGHEGWEPYSAEDAFLFAKMLVGLATRFVEGGCPCTWFAHPLKLSWAASPGVAF